MKLGLLVFFSICVDSICCKAQTVALDDYIRIAIARSPVLHEYRNQVQSNLIDSEKIRASYMPQVNAVANNIYAPGSDNFGYDQAITNGGTFSALLGVNKTFVSRQNLKTQYRTLGLQNDSVVNTAKISEQDLIRSVTTQYLTTYGDQQQLKASIEINILLQNEETILKNLIQNNIYRQTDYLTFLVTLKQQELQLKQQSIQYQTDFANLNYLCGIVDTGALTATLDMPLLEVSLPADPSVTVFFRRYKSDSLRLVNYVKGINFNYRPKLIAFADAGYNTSQLNTVYQNFGTSFGFSLSLPVYDGGRRKMEIRKISLLEDTRTGYRDFFYSQYSQQVAGLLQQLHATEALINDINEQINYSKGLIDVNQKLMQTGDAKISDYVIAINNYLTAKSLLTQNRISRMQIITQINYWSR